MNPTAIYSKSGKGVQEASGKTSLLPRPDRAVLSAIDGRATLAEVAQRVGRPFDAALEGLIAKLDKDGFIREVSSGVAAPAPKPAAGPISRPGAAAKQPAPSGPASDFGDLDFSALAPSKPASAPPRPAAPPPRPAAPPSRPAAPPPPPPAPAQPAKDQGSATLAKAREEAEARAQAERDRLKAEAESKTRAEMEARLRAEAEKKLKDEAEARAKADAEAKVKAAREAAIRAAADAKARAEAEARAKVEAERKAREETERRLEEERKAREEIERKARQEAERIRKEAEEKARREAEELRQRLEEERKARLEEEAKRQEAERKAKEEAERVRRELEEERKRIEAERKREEEERAARRKREDEEAEARRKQREEEERKAEEERAARRRQREEEDAREREEAAQREAKRKQREEEEAAARAEALKPEPKAPKVEAKKEEKKTDAFSDSLLADLASFTDRDEEDRKAKEDAERKAKAEAEQRAREEAQREAQRREKEESERRQREQEERRRKEEEARRAREEEEERAQEEQRRKREADEIRRKAEAATAAAMAKEGKAPPKTDDDIPVTDDDLDMDEVKREQAAIAKGKPKEPPPEKKKKEKEVSADAAPARPRRPGGLGKTIGIGLVALLVIGVGVAHVMPLGTADYERAASEALGRPVKIGSAKLWLFTGLAVRMKDVRVGDAKIAHVSAAPSVGSLFGEKKEFSRLELDGLTLPQAVLADALFAPVRADNFRVERIVVKNLELPGPATLPKALQADVLLDAKGAMRSATVRGPDGLVAKLAPKDDGVDVDVVAVGFTLPIAPQVTLSNFVLKAMATPRGMAISDWGGSIYSGAISGTANIRWGSTWSVDGVFTVRNINAAVLAPALLSAGTGEGTAKFSMNAPDPSGLVAASRLDGNFTVVKGTLGSFDLARAIQTNGKQAGGTTQFTEMNGQGVYDRGAVALRNITIGAGALNAGASADIAQNGALSGRIVADVRTAARTLSATLLLGGTVKDPQVRN
ncbi:MAG TPA: hypothetical protein VIV54_04975 [Burkholderiales bacterium]